MYMLIEGNVAAVKAFPPARDPLKFKMAQSKLYKVFCSSRQQLISAGRNHALQYTYFWQEPLTQVGTPPEISVTDLAGTEVVPGETNILPHNKTLRFKSVFDGELVVSNNRCIVDKRKSSADQYMELDGLTYGLSIQAIVGCDIIWQIEFQKQQFPAVTDEIEILKRITNVSGTTILAPHSLKNILVGMNRYPKICRWIQQCIKDGAIYEQSYRRLQEVYRGMNTHRQGGTS
jgi:hypothetical protein